MKLFGITCGRKMGNSEILAKEALMGAEEVSGVSVELLRLHDLTLKPCKGCEICVIDAMKGGMGKCVIKGDHLPFFLEKFTEADGVIFSFPLMWLAPPGLVRLLNERMVGYDFKIVRDGDKRRVAGLIAVGGTDWVSLGLPLMNTTLHPPQVIIIDQMQVTFSGAAGQVLLDKKAIDRARRLGRNVAEAMFKQDSEFKFMGDEPGQCPVCHSDAMMVRKKGPAECAICGSRGVLKIEGDNVSLVFNEKDLKKSRWSREGLIEHARDIGKVHEVAEQGKDEIKNKLEKYKSYNPITKVPSKVS